jgi:small-conductance mechanosensitive channel
MNKARNFSDALSSAASAIVDRVIEYLPSILGALVLIIIGWVVARILRVFTIHAVLLLDKLLAKAGAPVGAERFRVGRASAIFGTIIFWVVMLFFATAATQILGLQPFTDWLHSFIAYLPTLAAGVLIVAIGYVLSRFVADLIAATSTHLSVAQRDVLARAAQITIVTGAVLIGADQIGIEVTFLVIFVSAMVTGVVGGAAIAVGFGARDYVANLIGAHYLRQVFSTGQTLRVGDIEGRVLDITHTVVVLETAEGRVSLPARIYNEGAITVITRSNHG